MVYFPIHGLILLNLHLRSFIFPPLTQFWARIESRAYFDVCFVDLVFDPVADDHILLFVERGIADTAVVELQVRAVGWGTRLQPDDAEGVLSAWGLKPHRRGDLVDIHGVDDEIDIGIEVGYFEKGIAGSRVDHAAIVIIALFVFGGILLHGPGKANRIVQDQGANGIQSLLGQFEVRVCNPWTY